jgi:hypothetical protein
MTTRRFGEDEAREIFRLATTGDVPDRSLPADTGGLTLAQLQQIGEEAGIDAARVAQAAAQLDIGNTAVRVRRTLGMPIGVAQLLDLPRAPTEREWELLVTELRTTFGAQGVVTSSGSFRQWSNGELHVSIEPTERGQQLRMSTVNSLAQVFNAVGMLTGAMAIITSASVYAAGKPQKALVALGMFGGMSLAVFISNVVRLPGWARERSQQMDAVAARAVNLLSK